MSEPEYQNDAIDDMTKALTGAPVWHPFSTYPYGRPALYYVPPYETQSELVGRTVRHPERFVVMTLLRRQTFDGPDPTHWMELPHGPSKTVDNTQEVPRT